MENPEYSLPELTSRAERYCARAEHCAFDVRAKLAAWGGTPQQTEDVLRHLYAQRFLDDARYCRAFVHDKLLYQRWGKQKIRAMLQARRLPDADIKDALLAIDEEEYLRILRTVLAGKKNAPREAQIRFLLQRGFEYADIRQVLP